MNIRTSLAALIAASSVFAQDPPVIKTTVDEVVLDLVVRDKKGKPIKDLTAADITLMDNGVKQQIKGFRLVEGAEAIEMEKRTPLDPLRQLRLVTLVFEPVSQDARRIAKQAALELIKGDQGTNVFYSVMTINNGLFILQQFTSDKEKLRKAIEKATSGQFAAYASESERIRGELKTSMEQLRQMPAASALNTAPASQQQAGSQAGSQAVQMKLIDIQNEMLRFDQAVGAGENTRMSIFGLLSLVRGQQAMPGRKAILYFSEGLWIPTHLDVPWRNLMSTANRDNVTFYPIDARGVQTWGQNSSAAADMARAAAASATSITQDGGAVSVESVRSSETGESSVRNNVQLPLRDLAESTGGFLIGDTNDLRPSLRRVNEEVNSFYEVTYSPGITTYDGSFRKTSVAVGRKDLVVHARNGYFALPPDVRGGTPLMPYEVSLLKALDSKPLPRDVEFRTAAIRFEPGKESTKASLVMEVPFANLGFTEDAEKKAFRGRLSLMALVKDSKGEVVQKFSRDLPQSVPAALLPQRKAGNFVYREQMTLPAGRYTLESAVVDHETGKHGAKKAVLVVPSRVSGVGVSSLALVKNFEANAQGLAADDPFQYQGGRITPALANTLYAVKGAQMSMFFVVYPDPSIAEKPQVVMEYVLDGKPIGRGEVPLPAADASGKIPYVMSSPAENMPPGNYEVRLLVKQGNTVAEDRAFVTVAAKP